MHRTVPLNQAITTLQNSDRMKHICRGAEDVLRGADVQALLRRLQAGEVPEDPALAHALVFANSLDPKDLESYAGKLRALNDLVVGHPGELLLLARMVLTHSSPSGRARNEFELAWGLPSRELTLATLSGDGLKYGFRHQHDIALPTTQLVIEDDIGTARAGKFRPDGDMLEELIFRGPEKDGITDIVVGWADICEYSFKNKGVYTLAIAQMAKTLGVELPDPTG